MSNHRLTETSTRDLAGDEGRRARKAELTAICEPIVVENVGALTPQPYGASAAFYRDSFIFFYGQFNFQEYF
jgi:hypothetical protein